MWASCLTDSIKEWSCRRHCRKMAMQFRSVSLFRSMMFLACQGWGVEPRPKFSWSFGPQNMTVPQYPVAWNSAPPKGDLDHFAAAVAVVRRSRCCWIQHNAVWRSKGPFFCVLSVGLCSFDIEKSKSDWKWWEVLMRSPIVQSVGSGSKEFASGKLVLWTQKPCHAETKQPTSALVFARAGTLHHVSPFAAPSDRVVDFVGSCFSLVYVSSANPETVPM